MQSAARSSARGGVHIVLAQEEGGDIFVRSLLRGGQLSRQVRPLDKLVSVNGREVMTKDLAEVLPIVAGPEGSQVTFGFLRPSTNQNFVWTVTRTNTELQDIQVAMIEDILALLSTKEHPDKHNNLYDQAKANSWRIPGSLEGNLYLELVDQIKSVKRGELKAPDKSADVAVERLKNELRVAEESSNRLRQELAIRDGEEVAALTVTVNENPEVVADPTMRQQMQDALMRDISGAVGVPVSRFGVVGMHRAEGAQAVNVDMHILPPAPPTANGRSHEPSSRSLAAEVLSQSQSEGSPLRRTPGGKRIAAARMRREFEYVLMFKKTVQILQEELLALERAGTKGQGDARQLATNLSQSEQSLEAFRREVAAKNRQVEQLERELMAARSQARPTSTQESEKAAFARKTANIRQELADLQTQNAGLLDDRRRLDEELARVRSLLDNAAHERQTLDTEVTRLRGYEPTVSGLSSKIQAQDIEMKSVLDDSARLRRDLERALSQKQELAYERDRLSEDCTRLLRQMEPYDQEIRSLKEQLQRIPAVEGQNRKLAESLGDLQQRDWRIQQENDQLKDLVNQHSVRAHTLELELDRLREQLERMKPEDPAIKDALGRLQQENESLRARLYSMETTLQQADDVRARAEGQSSRLKEQHELESQRVRAAYAELDRIKLALDAANTARIHKEKELAGMHSQIATMEAQLRQQHSDHMMVKSKMEGQMALLDKEVAHHKASILQLQNTIEKLQQENNMTRQEAQRLRDVIWGLEEDKRRISGEMQVLQERISKYAEIHALDIREATKKDQVLKAQEEEISRLRASFVGGAPGPTYAR